MYDAGRQHPSSSFTSSFLNSLTHCLASDPIHYDLLFFSIYYYISNFLNSAKFRRSSMKRKSELSNSLNEMFSESENKRINAIKSIRIVATMLGPQRTRNELVPFLTQFLHEPPTIMLAVISQIEDLLPLLGGVEHEKLLLPLLIQFCSTDQKQVAMRAMELMKPILVRNPNQYVEILRRMMKIDMKLVKECSALLLIEAVAQAPHHQATFMQLYKLLANSEDPAVRIISAKHLTSLSTKSHSKQQILSILQIFYEDSEELPKLITLELLISLFPNNMDFVTDKVKSLLCQNKWRLNLRICECSQAFWTFFDRNHFKKFMQPAFIKMLDSGDIQIREAACAALPYLSASMSREENVAKLLPILSRLSNDTEGDVKKAFARNLVKTLPHFEGPVIKESILPIIIGILKQSQHSVSCGLLEDYKELSKHFQPSQFEQFVLKPLIDFLPTQDWRLKVKTLNLLARIATHSKFLGPQIIDVFVGEVAGRIESTRAAGCAILVSILKEQTEEWLTAQVLPKFDQIKHHSNYLVRQKILDIIENSAGYVSQTVLRQYRQILAQILRDPVPNLRVMALKLAASDSRLSNQLVQNQVRKLKSDTDSEVQSTVKMMKI